MKHVWVAAVPNSWNVAPSGHDPISGEEVDPEEAIFGTVVYRRFTPRWRNPVANAPVEGRGARLAECGAGSVGRVSRSRLAGSDAAGSPAVGAGGEGARRDINFAGATFGACAA